ncbi:uncharacterized protein PG998_006850 [Apiospora kogelbergensis]|uniref:uncharacterized protein n=1 Tax=Apiospora kogelbergensis TaxID=1337665 RepID=UPI0031307609
MDSVGFNKTLKVVKSVPWSASTNIDKFVANVFGVYLTEGLARTSLNRQTLIKISKTAESLLYTDLVYQEHADLDVNNITVTPFNISLDLCNQQFDRELLPIVIEVQRYGYETGQQRDTPWFAQTIMCIYLGTVLVYVMAMTMAIGHVLALFRVRTPGPNGHPVRVLSVAAWSDLQDLMIRALKTPAPGGDLADAGGGVKSDSVWKKIVRARADERDHVQLVLDGEGEGEMRKLGETGKDTYY